MEIFGAFDLTRCAHSAAQLAGCDAKTVARYVSVREAGGDPFVRAARPKAIDGFLAKIEEKVDASRGKVRADVVHRSLVAMGFAGSERSTRRAVAEIKAAWRAGRRRRYRPWLPEPGMWLQFDWGAGPRIGGRGTQLFCAWLAWSRFRVVIPAWDQTLGSLVACVDATLRRVGGAPTYLLSDNAKTVTVEHVAGVAIRHPQMVALGRHYGCVVESCEPFDPESKGGVEATVKIAKADLVPTSANLRPDYDRFAELAAACEAFCARVNARAHRETAAAPVDRLAAERARLHVLPAGPHTLALGEERLVADDQTIRFASVRYSTPPGHVGERVWCRVVGEERVLVAHGEGWLAEIARHPLSTPGNPRIADEHYPGHPGGNGPRQPRPRPRTAEEEAFLALGAGARRWLIEAGAIGATRVRAKMARAVDLAGVLGAGKVDQALGLAAIAGGSPRTTCPPSWTTWPSRAPRPVWSSPTTPTPRSPAPPAGPGSATRRRPGDRRRGSRHRRRGDVIVLTDEVADIAAVLGLVEDWLLHTEEFVLDDLAGFDPAARIGGARPVIDALGDAGASLARLLRADEEGRRR